MNINAALNIIYGITYKNALNDEKICAILLLNIVIAKSKTARDMSIIATNMYLRGEM